MGEADNASLLGPRRFRDLGGLFCLERDGEQAQGQDNVGLQKNNQRLR